MKTVHGFSNKLRHWFWHVIAVFAACDLGHEGLTDEEWANYTAFMKARGYDDQGSIVP